MLTDSADFCYIAHGISKRLQVFAFQEYEKIMGDKFVKFGLLCILLATGLPLYGADINVLTNPGFESGTSEWIARNCSITTVSSPVHSGSNSGRAYDRTATWQGIQQDMRGKMVEGATYTLSGWIRTSSVASSDIHITFQKTDGGNNGDPQYQWAASGTANNSEWTYISGNYTLNIIGTLTQLLVYVEGPDSGIDIYVDNMEVYGPEVTSSSTASGTIDINTQYQVIEGFGAAGAWYEGWLTAHPQRETLYDLFFDELGLDIYRLRNTHDQSTDYMTRSAEIVTEAKERNPNLKILISSWSPPTYLKSNGDIAGGGDATLIGGPSSYDYAGFANWWADSITAWWNDYGVHADYISIQNEPDYDASWDSCRFDPTENSSVAGYDQAFETVYNEMYSRFGASMPKMLAPECIGLGYSTLDNFLNAIINHNHVYGYAHHLYHGGNGQDPDSYLPEMQALNVSWGSKPLFQTEYENRTDASAWPDAYNIALLLHNALTAEEVSGYLYWDLFWAEPGGLVGFPSYGSSSYTIHSDFYGFKQYSAFIYPDWQRIDATDDSSDVRMSAYISPDESQMTVVIINTSASTDIDLTLSFTDFTIASGTVYRTSQMENCASIGRFDPGNPLTLPAQSVTTLSLNADFAMTPPGPPQGLVTTEGDTVVSLDWDDNVESDLAGYNIYRSTTSGSGYTQINAALLSNSEFIDNTVVNYTTYYYVVTAEDTDMNESAYSAETDAMPNDGGIIQLSGVDFESGFGDWTNISGDDSHDWTRNSGSTPSPNTGPDSGANDSTWYVYLECSPGDGGANTAGDTAILESPDLHGFSRTLTFYYHMYGIHIGTLNVDVYDGTWHDGIWNLSGQQHTSDTEEYTQAIVDLSAYTGLIRIRFRAVAAGNNAGDMAIDDITVNGATLYGDMNYDNIVNADDLPIFAGYWLLENCTELDLNGDCLINLNELSKLAKNWFNASFQ